MADALDPVIERIVKDLTDTLEGVTTAAGANQSLIVERPKPALGNRTRDSLAVLVTGNPVKIDGEGDDGPAYGHDEWLQPFSIVVTVVESESSDASVDRRLNIIRCDVEKAVMEDHTRGGLAIDTRVMAPHIVEQEKLNANVGEIWINILVHYRTLEGDPYSQ